MKKIFFCIAIGCFFLGVVPHILAAQNFVPLAGIPGLTQNVTADSAGLAGFFNNLYKYLIGLAAVLAVIEIIWGGLEISTKDSVSKKSDGKARITQAVLGLVLVLSPALVFSIINPSILNLSLNLPALNTATGNGAGNGTVTPVNCANCGKSITVTYYIDPNTCQPPCIGSNNGAVVPRDEPTKNSFAAGCAGGKMTTNADMASYNSGTLGGPPSCTSDTGIGIGFLGTASSYRCWNETLTCSADTTTANQQDQSGCTTSGTAGVLQIATCPSLDAGKAWVQSCSSGGIATNDPLTTNATTGAVTSYIATCQGTQTYVFISTAGLFNINSAINQLQPIAQTSYNPINGSAAINFANTCKNSTQNLGWKTCVNGVNWFSDTVPCPSTIQLPAGSSAKCYQKTLVCGNNSFLHNTTCSTNPSWTIFQN